MKRARRKETLSKVADYCDPACPRVDDELIARLKAVHNYGRGLRYARQTLYAQYDMALHTADALKVKPLETWQKWKQLQLWDMSQQQSFLVSLDT